MKALISLLQRLPHLSRLQVFICLCLTSLAPQTTQAAPTTTNFAYTGADQTYVVPAGVTSITVKLWGAGGGQVGGSGAFVSGDLTVTPSETLTIITGCGGGIAASGLTSNAYGGGGRGKASSVLFNGGGGGGRSAIRRGANELVTAGAGGGGLYTSANTQVSGGAGGLAAGGAGQALNAGLGGTQTTGNAPFTGGDYILTGTNFIGGGGGAGYWGGFASSSGVGTGGGGSSLTTNLSNFSGQAGVMGNRNGSAPGGTSDPNYVAGVGRGGNQHTLPQFADGGNGLVVIIAEASAPAPTVTAISPTSGTTAGGTSVTITGTDLTGATGVTIGGVAATSVTVVNATTITATTPAGTGTAKDVVVTVSGQPSTGGTGLFSYSAPTVASISPTSGSTAGGMSVTITGTNFGTPATVTIGGNAATSVTVVDATTITATTPAGTAGAKDVVVIVSGQTSTGGTGLYTYVAPPTVVSISPNTGSTAGGTSVTITGTDLTAATGVTIGGAAAPITAITATEITATTPAHAAGAVSVEVTTPGGTNAANTLFTYFTPPEITVFDGIAPPANERADNVGTFSFGSVNIGSSSAAQTFTIQNTGTAPLTLGTVTITGADSGQFSVTQPLSTSLAATATTTFTVTFSPTLGGAKSASIQIASDDADENPFDIALSGTVGTFLPGYNWTGNAASTSTGSVYDYSYGSEFTAVATVQLTHLGVYDHNQDGLARSMQVKLWNANTQQELASTTVSSGTADTLIGSSRYHQLTTPVTLQAGTRYIVSAYYQSPYFFGGSAEPVGSSTAITTDPRIEYHGYAYYSPTTYSVFYIWDPNYGYVPYAKYYGTGFYFPSNRSAVSTSSAFYFGANFLLQTAAPTNVAPTDIALTATSVAENQASGTTVATISGTDPDSGQSATLAFSLVAGAGGTDNASFSVVGTTLKTAASFNFEAQSSYSIRLRATDTGTPGLTYEEVFMITITDVNEAPTISDVTDSSTNEDTATLAIPFTIGDVDAGASLSLSATSGNTTLVPNGNVVLGGSGANRTVTITPVADMSGDTLITLTVSDGALTASDTFTLTVNAVNDAPVITSNGGLGTASINVAENSTAVTTVTATDVDLPAQTLTYSKSGTDAALFTIIPSTGVLTFTTAPNFEAATDVGGDNVYDVTVTITDNGTGALTDTQVISVTVTDVNEAPVITSNGGGGTAAINLAENSTTVTTVNAVDPEVPATQTLTYSKSGADAAKFTIIPSTGVLTFTTAPNFEAPTDIGSNNVYDVTVTVTDNGTGLLTDSQDLSITITDVNETEIVIEQPMNTGLTDGVSSIAFGTADVAVPVPLTFTIRNTGEGLMSIGAITFDGTTPGDFSVTTAPAASLGTGGSTTFVVTFTPLQAGARSAVMHLVNGDANENPFDIALTGTGTNRIGNTFTGGGTPLVDIPSGSFVATGLNFSTALGFTPSPGADYTFINIQGSPPAGIIGEFNDLPDGGVVAMAIGGVIHYFQADYHAGTDGNDLVLTAFTPGQPAWSWQSGPKGRNGAGRYGARNVGSEITNPGARQGAMQWRAPDGSLWMFGGYGYATALTNPPRWLNDLWQYNRTTGRWIWRNGANRQNIAGTYGTIGSEAAANTPGARHTGTTWTDSNGNLWLFGGVGPNGRHNDLWRYNITSGNWACMKGADGTDELGDYGTQGVPDSNNIPGARQGSTGWATSDGSLWLFGGTSDGTATYFNDLWRYDIASGNWTWIKGSNTPNANGSYGTQGSPGGGNTPGARRLASGWVGPDGSLWMFGGQGRAATGSTIGDLNDLWRYDRTSTQWEWVRGSDALNSPGSYGTLGTPAAGNEPPARGAGGAWTTVDGKLWLVGGMNNLNNGPFLNDVWIYDTVADRWTWKLGSSTPGASGVYGTLGVANAANNPGARFTPSTWVTLNGAIWIFGGGGTDAFGNVGRLSDLWVYSIPAPAGAPALPPPAPFPDDLIVNAAPNANNATAGTMAYVPVSGQLTGSDADGDKLTFTVLSQGTLTLQPNGQWTYAPAPGFTGTASFQFKASDSYGGESPVRTLVVTVSTNPADSDNDGIADAYEQSTFGGIAAADGEGDADLDGQTNYFEFIAGTDPLDAGERLATAPSVAGAGTANGTLKLQLNHVRPGVNYHLETSPDLDVWTRLGTFTFSVAGSAEIEDPTPATGAPRFYRMNLEATTLLP